MKNRIKFLGLVFLMFILTTGCMNYEIDMKVNSDRSVDCNINFSLDMNEYKEYYDSFLESSLQSSCYVYGIGYTVIEKEKN